MPFSLYPNQLIVTHFFVHFTVRELVNFCTFFVPFCYWKYTLLYKNIHFFLYCSHIWSCESRDFFCISFLLPFYNSLIRFFLCLFRFSVFFTNRYKGLKIFPFLIFSSLSSGWFWALEANMSSFYLSVFVFFFCSSLFLLLPSLLTLSLSSLLSLILCLWRYVCLI